MRDSRISPWRSDYLLKGIKEHNDYDEDNNIENSEIAKKSMKCL